MDLSCQDAPLVFSSPEVQQDRIDEVSLRALLFNDEEVSVVQASDHVNFHQVVLFNIKLLFQNILN